MTDSAAIRSNLIDTLRRDLIGPNPDDADLATETLKERPSRWYLTGYLVPLNAPEDQREGTSGGDDSLDSGGGDADGHDDASEPDPVSARRAFLPSSIGVSVLVEEGTSALRAEVTWGDYLHEMIELPAALSKSADALTTDDPTSASGDEDDLVDQEGGDEASAGEGKGNNSVTHPRRTTHWLRIPRREIADLDLTASTLQTVDVPNSNGLKLAVLARSTTLATPEGSTPARAVSVFVVNERPA